MANVPSLSDLPRRSTLVTTATRARDRLTVQPRPDALGVAQVAVLPLLAACGHDVTDLDVLRGSVEGRRLLYRLRVGEDTVAMVIQGVGDPLTRPLGTDEVDASSFTVRSNGGEWQLLLPGEKPYRWSLYDELFARLFETLFDAGASELGRRAASARSLLQQQWLTDVLARLAAKLGPDAVREQLGDPLEATERATALLDEHGLLNDGHSVDPGALRHALATTLFPAEVDVRTEADVNAVDVIRYCEPVRHFRGRLRATFDGTDLPVTSRAGLYYVLACIALQRGREDAIPAEDLVRPPRKAPAQQRVKALERSGWWLILTKEAAELEEAVAALLDRLVLRSRLVASQRDRPWPSREASQGPRS